jgi:hypothetical protein
LDAVHDLGRARSDPRGTLYRLEPAGLDKVQRRR